MKEEWKDIPKYNGKYQASNLGRIKSTNIEHIHNGGKTTQGYHQVCITFNGIQKTKKTHRLVAQTFIPNPLNKPCVNHKDGNKMNNNIDNLEWCTHSENSLHSFANGLQKPLYGKDNPSYGKTGKLHKQSKEIQMLSLNGKLLKIFESGELAIKWLRENGYPKANSSSVSQCCRGIKYKKAYNKKWRYTNV